MPSPAVSPPSILPLVEQWEAYVRDCGATNATPALPAFSSWLARQLAADAGEERAHETELAPHAPMRSVDRVGMYIWRLARFMRTDFKRHFSGSPLQNVDEFLLLGGAHHLAAPTKTQLFEYGLLETTTGLQMLARLVRDGLVTETADATDRRLKRITLTAAGQAELEEAVRRLHAVDDELFHLLSPTDLAYIEHVLEKLNAYHTARSAT